MEGKRYIQVKDCFKQILRLFRIWLFELNAITHCRFFTLLIIVIYQLTHMLQLTVFLQARLSLKTSWSTTPQCRLLHIILFDLLYVTQRNMKCHTCLSHHGLSFFCNKSLLFYFWYISEKNVACCSMVRILQVTGVFMVYIASDHYLAYCLLGGSEFASCKLRAFRSNL